MNRIEYTVYIWQEGAQFVAHAMPLDVMSCGATPEGARTALDEAVQLFFDTAVDQGTLDEILREAGYQLQEKGWVSPPWISIERHSAAVRA